MWCGVKSYYGCAEGFWFCFVDAEHHGENTVARNVGRSVLHPLSRASFLEKWAYRSVSQLCSALHAHAITRLLSCCSHTCMPLLPPSPSHHLHHTTAVCFSWSFPTRPQEKLEHYQFKLRIAERKGREAKVAKMHKKIDRMRRQLAGETLGSGDEGEEVRVYRRSLSSS